MPELIALVTVLALAAAHSVPPFLGFIDFVPRSWMLSAAGGVSVAYVFVHLIPEIARAQAAVDERSGVIAALERHAYVAALIGLLVFYGLERAALRSREERAEAAERGHEPTSPGVFWLSIVSFGLYNAVIGYLVVRRAQHDSIAELAVFAAALGVHFVINDLGLREHHRRRYDHLGRHLLLVSLLAGWGVGVLVDLTEAAVGLVVAFLAGAIVLNVMKEELPQERQSRFLPLLLGGVLYTGLLLAA